VKDRDPYLLIHAPGAPGLRLLGLGPRFMPHSGLFAVWKLLSTNAFWAQQRSLLDVKKMLAGSRVVVTLWKAHQLVGFGRATTDGVYRAVLWDVVVDQEHQSKGYGRKIVSALLNHPSIKKAEKVYVMTTNSERFYLSLGFSCPENQRLLVLKNFN